MRITFFRARWCMLFCCFFISGYVSGQTDPKPPPIKYNNKLHIGTHITSKDGEKNVDREDILFTDREELNTYLVFPILNRPINDLRSFKDIQIISFKDFNNLSIIKSLFSKFSLINSFRNVYISGSSADSSVFFVAAEDSLSDYRQIPHYRSLIIDSSVFKGDFTLTSNLNQFNLTDVSIHGDLDLSNSTIGAGNGKVKNCRVGGTIDLHNLSLANNAELDIYDVSPLDSGEKIPVNLAHAQIAGINLDYEKDSLVFSDSDTSFNVKSNTYLKLLQNFKDRGYTKSYELADIDYQKLKNGYEGHWYKKCYDVFQQLWWNYGYSKWYIFIWTLGSLFIFSIINYWFFQKMNKEVYTLYAEFPQCQKAPIFSRVAKNYYYSVVYTSVIFFSFTVKTDKLQYENRRLLIWFLLIYTLGVICLAYLANFVLKTSI